MIRIYLRHSFLIRLLCSLFAEHRQMQRLTIPERDRSLQTPLRFGVDRPIACERIRLPHANAFDRMRRRGVGRRDGIYKVLFVRLLVHLGYHVHVAAHFANHCIDIIDFIYLFLLFIFNLLAHLQLLDLRVLLLDHLHQITDLVRVVVPHRIQILLQLLPVARFHLLNFENVYHIGRKGVVAVGNLRCRRLILLIQVLISILLAVQWHHFANPLFIFWLDGSMLTLSMCLQQASARLRYFLDVQGALAMHLLRCAQRTVCLQFILRQIRRSWVPLALFVPRWYCIRRIA